MKTKQDKWKRITIKEFFEYLGREELSQIQKIGIASNKKDWKIIAVYTDDENTLWIDIE